MPGLVIWKNQQVEKLRRDVDRMFERLWGEFGLSPLRRAVEGFPSIVLTETEDTLVIKSEIPDIDPKDLEINLTERTLNIRGKTSRNRVRDKAGFVKTEHSYRSFSKTLQLPYRIVVEDAKATYKEGVLSISMPKFKQRKTRAIKIET